MEKSTSALLPSREIGSCARSQCVFVVCPPADSLFFPLQTCVWMPSTSSPASFWWPSPALTAGQAAGAERALGHREATLTQRAAARGADIPGILSSSISAMAENSLGRGWSGSFPSTQLHLQGHVCSCTLQPPRGQSPGFQQMAAEVLGD